MIQGVLFDMDGILFDTERLTLGICREEIEAMGYQPPENLAERVCGVNHTLYHQTIMEMFGPAFDFAHYDRVVHEKNAAVLEEHGVPQKPGLFELLDYLKAHNIPAAVASSTRHATVCKMLESAGIRPYFQVVIGGDMVTNSKPDPEIFLKAAAALGLDAKACLAVEDSTNGVRSAAAAGCVTVMIPDLLPPTEELRGLASVVLQSLAEVPAYIESLAP